MVADNALGTLTSRDVRDRSLTRFAVILFRLSHSDDRFINRGAQPKRICIMHRSRSIFGVQERRRQALGNRLEIAGETDH